MSLRSQRSARSAQHGAANIGHAQQQHVSDADVYGFALRVAILQHVIACKPAPAAVPSTSTATTSNGPQAGSSKRDGLRRTITEAGWTSTFSSLSLGDLFRGDSKSSGGTGSPKYPERFVKVLEHKIESISRGTDAVYNDMLLRFTIGAFYGKFKDPKNARAIKENRKLEDLIMMYIATSTDVLRKRCSGDEWKIRLEGQVEAFVKICDECLRHRDVKHVPPELFTKLDALKSKMSANRPPPMQSQQDSDARTSMDASTNGNSSASRYASISYSISDMPYVQQLGRVFDIDPDQLQKDVNGLKKVCTEKAALADLKMCINLISSGAPFPGCRDDFPTDEAYRDWRQAELSNLQQAMLSMIQSSPELVEASRDNPGPSQPANTSVTEAGEAYVGRRQHLPIAEQFASVSLSQTGSTGSARSGEANGDTRASTPMTEGLSGEGTSLTYVPGNVRQAYGRLLEVMLSHDLAAMANLDPSEEVPLRILSKANTELLRECAYRWRVMQPSQYVAFLEEMLGRYTAGEMPVVECILEALSDFDKVNEDWPCDAWPTTDRDVFLVIVSQLLDTLLRAFYETYSEQLPPESISPIVEVLNYLRDLPVFEEAIPQQDLEERYEQLRDGIRRVSDYLYDRERDMILSQHGPDSIVPMLDLQQWIKQTAKRLDKHYKAPLLGAVDMPQLFLERVPDIYLHDLTHRLQAIHQAQAAAHKPEPLISTPNDKPLPPTEQGLKDGEVMALYTGVKEITEMHRAFCPDTPLRTSVNNQFEPYIMRWLAETDKKTLTWVRSAINVDHFDPEEAAEGDGHSSSIVDLIASCKGAVQFVTDLGWPDEYQNALFLTKLAGTVSKAIEQYCMAIEELYMREMTPPRRDDSTDSRDERTSAWLTRAKALYQEKKLEQFKFKPTSCIKLNNIHAARQLLDKMYSAIEADKVAEITRQHGPALPSKGPHAARNLFTIKIVLGEGLSTADGVSRVDPFVTLSDERGLRIAKTRTLYETTEPRWAETFDVSVEGKMWIAATVWDRNLVDEHELLGRTYLNLDPNIYSDFLPRDLWQELDTVGRLLLRVSMEGEKDDIQFYFGRAFRSLKRAENDMTRIIVDKLSPFIRSCISQNSLKSLIKKGGFAYLAANLNIDKAKLANLNLDKMVDKARLENMRNLIRTKDPYAPEIPLPPSPYDQSNKPLPSPAPTEKKRQGDAPLTDAQIEEPLGPLLEYLDQCLEIFRKHLSESAWQVVMTKIWKEVLTVVESLLVPALSDQPTEMKPLSDKEVDIVFKWLKFLTDFFYADGHGVPIEDLRNPRYRAIMMIRLYYDWSTDQLMEESVRLTNQQLMGNSNAKSVARSKSVYQQRNLGTIKKRKQEKQEDPDSGAAEMVMRILRMRAGSIDFLQQQMATLNLVQEKQRKPTRLLGSIRGRGRGRGMKAAMSALGRGHRMNASTNRLPPIPSAHMAHQQHNLHQPPHGHQNYHQNQHHSQQPQYR